MRSTRFTLVLAALVAAPAASQALYSFDVTGVIRETRGSVDPELCFGLDPEVSSFPVDAPSSCFVPGQSGALLGGITVDPATDTVWISDGFTVGHYDSDGTHLTSFMAPGAPALAPLTGLAWDSSSGSLWVVDGTRAAELSPPGTCGGDASFLTAPFTVPAGFATGIDVDPTTGLLWYCDLEGMVHSMQQNGATSGLTPYSTGLVGAPVGIALDRAAAPGSAFAFVTDGLDVRYLGSDGAFGPQRTYMHSPISPAPAFTHGLAFSGHTVPYAASTLPGLELASVGHSIVPNPAYKLEVTGAGAGSVVLFRMGFGQTCPPFVFEGVPIHLDLTFPILSLGNCATGAGDSCQLNLPLPGVGPGISATLQAFVITNPFAIHATHGAAMTTVLP
jgi:hypothetical protein